MKTIWYLTERNLKRYYRDKGALLFSLLSVFIIVALNIFFLADMQISEVSARFGDRQGIDVLIYSFVLGGLLCVPAVTVPVMMLTFKVDDAAQKTQDDLFVTPVCRIRIMLGYIFSAWTAGFIMTIITLFVGEAFIIAKGGELLGAVQLLKIAGISAITILAFSGFSFFIIAPLKSSSSLMVVNTILNTLVGFFAGLYIPIGVLSEEVATVIKAFPLSHAAALLRRIFMEQPIDIFVNGESPSAADGLRQMYGADISLGGHVFKEFEMFAMIAGFGLVFYICSAVFMKKSKSS